MTREEYNEKSEDMKDFAKYQIDEENLYFAIHVQRESRKPLLNGIYMITQWELWML